MEHEIPKIIHYCWFGGKPLPKMAKKCIKSWKKYFPDYEIKEWNETNFDVNCIPYVKEAYQAKKFAFVSDYARFWILYNYGGIYFDTDVEVIKSFDDIIAKGSFMGCQNKSDNKLPAIRLGVAPGLGLGSYPKHYLYKEMLEIYNGAHFVNPDQSYNTKTVVSYMTEILVKYGLENVPTIQCIADTYIYPWDYFCPMSPMLVLEITDNSRSIHLFSATWESRSVRLRKYIKRKLGYKIISKMQPCINILHRLLNN